MPRVSKGEAGALTFKVRVTEVEHSALFRDLMRIESGAKRKARLFLLAHIGLALEGSADGSRTEGSLRNGRTNRPPHRILQLSNSELADLFEDSSTPAEEQGA